MRREERRYFHNANVTGGNKMVSIAARDLLPAGLLATVLLLLLPIDGLGKQPAVDFWLVYGDILKNKAQILVAENGTFKGSESDGANLLRVHHINHALPDRTWLYYLEIDCRNGRYRIDGVQQIGPRRTYELEPHDQTGLGSDRWMQHSMTFVCRPSERSGLMMKSLGTMTFDQMRVATNTALKTMERNAFMDPIIKSIDRAFDRMPHAEQTGRGSRP